MPNYECRYCEHLIDVSPPRANYIGRCEYRLCPETCGRFELAKCYDGHYPTGKQEVSKLCQP